MAGYLGQKPAVNGIYTVDELTSSGGNTYTLSRAPGSKNNIQVSAGGLVQYPSAYSVSGTTLTLSGVPSGQKVIIRHMGETILYPNLDDNIVTSAKINANAVTGAKIAMTSDARGDILYYNGTDYARLAKGSSGTVLKMGANDPAWGADSVDLTADQSWTGSQRATMVTDNDGSFDMNAGQNFNCTPSGNFTLTFTNIANGQSGFIILINSGGHTVSLHANSKADANLTGVVSTAGTYILSYISNGTNVYLTNSAVIA